MQVPYTPEQMADFTVELLRRDGLQEDIYVRPLIYKSSELIGVRLHNLDADFTMFAIPFGKYIDTEAGVRAQVSSWRRTDDNAIPARGKVTGAYGGVVNRAPELLHGKTSRIEHSGLGVLAGLPSPFTATANDEPADVKVKPATTGGVTTMLPLKAGLAQPE